MRESRRWKVTRRDGKLYSRNFVKYLIATAAFGLFFSLTCRGIPETRTQPIQAEINPEKPLWLRITLQSFAETSLSLDKDDLPWGREDRIILAAVTSEGKHLERFLHIDDPRFGRIMLKPRQKVSGEINLTHVFKGLENTVKETDVHVFWAYKAPEQLNIGSWSGGWVLIPQQK
jgi:hypothetical protein